MSVYVCNKQITEYENTLKPRTPDHTQRTSMIKPDLAEQKARAILTKAVTSSCSSRASWSALEGTEEITNQADPLSHS